MRNREAHVEHLRRNLNSTSIELFDHLLSKPDGLVAKDLAQAMSLSPAAINKRVERLRSELRGLRDQSGTVFAETVDIRSNPYRCVWEPKQSSIAASQTSTPGRDRVHEFWKPHFEDDTLLVAYGALLFWRSPDGKTYSRDFRVNEDIDPSPFPGYKPSFHYVSVGDMECIFSIVEAFHNNRQDHGKVKFVELKTWRPDLASGRNFVTVGNARNNKIIRELTQGRPIKIQEWSLLDGSGRERHPDPREDWTLEHAVVTRTAYREGTIATFVASNHGGANAAVARLLCNPENLDEVLFRAGWDRDPMPQSFDLLFEVEISDKDRRVGNPRLVDWWPQKTTKKKHDT